MSIKPLTAFALSLGLGVSLAAEVTPRAETTEPAAPIHELHQAPDLADLALLKDKVIGLRKDLETFAAKDLREELSILVDLFQAESIISADESRDIKTVLIARTSDGELADLASNLCDIVNQ